MRYSFDAGDAPTAKETQYFEMLGTRGIWHKGWKAVTEHAPMPSNKGHFDQDRWQLFHTDDDRSEAVDESERHPEKVKELVDLWFAEAEKYNVLPLCDLGLLDYMAYEFHAPVPKSGLYTYYPDTAEVPERSGAANFHGVSYKILAEVEIADQSAQGVILAQARASAATRCSSRTAGCTTSTTSWASSPSSTSSPSRSRPAPTSLGSSSSSKDRASIARPWARPSST